MKTQSQKTAGIPLWEKEACSIPETALIADVGKDTIYNEINSGRLRSLKIGKRRLVRREARQAWLAEREAATSTA